MLIRRGHNGWFRRFGSGPVLVALAVTGCSGPELRPASAEAVLEGSSASTLPASSGALRAPDSSSVGQPRPVHEVQSGDTLTSIAWRHGLAVRDIVAWNALSDPDLIRVGQWLYLAPELTAEAVTEPASDTGSANNGEAAEPRAAEPRAAGLATTTRPPVEHPAKGVRPASRSSPVPGPESRWRWPVRGPLVSAYGAAEGPGEGIGIGRAPGQDILAAAPGEVAYAGRGLAAYGLLVIRRHDDEYLSAYGHNAQLRVEEGERVVQGQPIATMGLGPDRQPQVHFEIPHNGIPVNTMDYLPK